MPRDFGRHLRVGAELKRILNDLLLAEVKDPRLRSVRVSEVEVSGDLGVARVFYSTLDPDEDRAPIDAALVRASAFMRSRIGRDLKLRRTPELRFEPDLSAQQGFRIANLIDQATTSESDDGTRDDGE